MTESGWAVQLCLWSLNPAVAFKELTDKARCVILTSGTLAPTDSFASEVSPQNCPFPFSANKMHAHLTWRHCTHHTTACCIVLCCASSLLQAVQKVVQHAGQEGDLTVKSAVNAQGTGQGCLLQSLFPARQQMHQLTSVVISLSL